MNDEEKLEKYIEFENSLTIYDDNKVLSELEKIKKENDQRIDELERIQKITLARIEQMGGEFAAKQNKMLDEGKEMTNEQLREFAGFVRLQMDMNPEYAEHWKGLAEYEKKSKKKS